MGLFDAFSPSDEQRYASQGYKKMKKGIGEGVDAIGQGKTEALGYQDQGIQPFQQLSQQGQQGIDFYGQLLGLGGGDPAARQSFLENTPGYQFTRDQAIQALDRQANAKGNPYNATDVMQYASGLAGQNYFNTLNAAQPYFGLGQNAASGIQQGYSNKSNIASGAAQNIANLKVQKGQAGYQHAADMSAAQSGADQNLWNAILGVGNIAASAFAASDIRVKTDIKQVGTLNNGLPVYLFRYKDGGPFQIGLMAQDVELVNPDAVREFDGVKHVYYPAATGA